MFQKYLGCYIIICCVLTSCSRYPFPNEHDPYNGKTRQEYEDILAAPKVLKRKPKKEKPPLKVVKLHPNFYKKVNLTLSENVSIKSVVTALAQSVNVDLEMVGTPTFAATNLSFIDAIDRITSLIKWRYTVDDNRLRLETATAQVLIEAKVVEVTLNDNYRSGINWGVVQSIAGGSFVTKGIYGGAKDVSDGLLLRANKDEMEGIFNLIDKFGTTRTLSSPRLTVMNNQPAILKVVKNHVYFNVRYDTYQQRTKENSTHTEPFTNIQSQVQTVPIGLILTVQPSIDIETGEIVMALRPTISSCSGYEKDPAVELAAKKLGHDIISRIPVVKIDEINSVLRMGEDMVILGGMMQEVVTDDQNGLPGLIDNPISGLFTDKQDSREVKELVIFLRAIRIDEEGDEVTEADERLLKKFTTDPRPVYAPSNSNRSE